MRARIVHRSWVVLAAVTVAILAMSSAALAVTEVHLIKDIKPNGTSSPGSLARVGGSVFFAADDGAHGAELWKSDGTARGTVLVKDIWPGPDGSTPAELTNVGGVLFFVAQDDAGGIHGRELWKTDGTAQGTVMVKDIYAGGIGSFPAYLTNVNGVLLFNAKGSRGGRELYKSDGTASGTVMVDDIYPGGRSSVPILGPNGASLPWRFPTTVGETLYFSAKDGVAGRELWKTDGTATGTRLVKDIHPGLPDSSPAWIAATNGTVFFQAGDGTNGRELWKTDGSAAGTVMVKNIRAGSNSSTPVYMGSVGGLALFRATDGPHGCELWRSDGTTAGTVMIEDINPYSSSCHDIASASLGGAIFFDAYDGTNDISLWKTDGTATGTTSVTPIGGMFGLTRVGGTLYVNSQDFAGRYGSELWESDGTAAGTFMVADIYPGEGESAPASITPMGGGRFFFTADDGTHGREVWMSIG